MKIFLTTCLACVMYLPFFAQQGAVIDEIIGVVGNEIILYSELELQAIELKQGLAATDDEKCEMLESLLFQKLLLHQARVDSIEVTPQEVDREIERRLQYYISLFGSAEDFEKYYGKSVIEWKSEFRSPIREKLMIEKFQQQLNSDVLITPGEVKTFYESLPQDSLPLINAQIAYSQIIIQPEVEDAQKLATYHELDSIRSLIIRGESSMSYEAGKHSEDPGSRYKGGCYELLRRGSFVPEYEAAVFETDEGDYSPIFETVYGYHFVKVTEKRGEYYASCHILMKPKINTAEVEEARFKLEDVRSLILADSLSFEKAAMEFSTDENSSNMGGKVMDFNTGGMMHEINSMDPTLFFAIDQLQVGEISEPIRLDGQDGTAYYVIIKLDKRKDAHRANLKDDYAIFQQQAEAIKKNDALEKWMAMQIARTYTQLDPQYRNCPFTYHWVK